jgi:hypothetical protein
MSDAAQDAASWLRRHLDQALALVESGGWDVTDLALGADVEGAPIAEAYVAERSARPGEGTRYARLWCQVAEFADVALVQWRIDNGPSQPGWYFVGRTSARKVTSVINLAEAEYNGSEEFLAAALIQERDEKVFGLDVGNLFGDQASTVSVFAAVGYLLGGILGKVGEDAVEALKHLSRRGRTAQVLRPDWRRGEWAIRHDAHLGTVFEFPVPFPDEAAIQLARMNQAQLRRSHLRWNPQTDAWDTVGSLGRDAFRSET